MEIIKIILNMIVLLSLGVNIYFAFKTHQMVQKKERIPNHYSRISWTCTGVIWACCMINWIFL